MGKVVIRHAGEAEAVPFSGVAGASTQGEIRSRPVIQGAERPLFLWRHDMRAGAWLHFDKPAVGHVLYVLSGAIEVNGATVEENGTACVEHDATADVRAARETVLYHFHEREPRHVSRPGGHVHLTGAKGILQARHDYANHLGTLWLDADCPNCELWLHRSEFTAPRQQRHSHYHTTDEIIVLLKGTMKVGNRALRPGTALAIDSHTPYGFGAPETGLAFINFRATDSSNVQLPPEGEQPPYNERDHFRANAIGT
jgi:hypothetical protein